MGPIQIEVGYHETLISFYDNSNGLLFSDAVFRVKIRYDRFKLKQIVLYAEKDNDVILTCIAYENRN